MEQESFEDTEVSEVLNKNFVCIKVDKEERPDIDSIYMNVCQALTGSGGWPLTILMTPDQKPFFAGTYFPKEPRHGSVGIVDLLLLIKKKWANHKTELIQSGNKIVKAINHPSASDECDSAENLLAQSIKMFKKSFDKSYGGFGTAPKFPSPHNLLFLLLHYERSNDQDVLHMAEKTLLQMYKGGIFDHIGFGFSRYSTDKYWLAPHFEKMLYDNALLVIAYVTAFRMTRNEIYKSIAIKTMEFILREFTDAEGGFYCAQDADSEGVEGKYYVFTPDEIINLLGTEDGEFFNQYFDITTKGNFEGKNIPNLIKNNKMDARIERLLPAVYQYRKGRTNLHKDDKILTSWNSLMIVAFAKAYKTLDNIQYLAAAEKANAFIQNHLCDGTTVFTSFRDGKRSNDGFLDDYAFYVFAQLELYEATYDKRYLDRAVDLNNKIVSDFYDDENGGFYLYGRGGEQLILRPKETYDGAIPSGNSVMSYNLLKLAQLTKNADAESMARKQLDFMTTAATSYPAGYGFFMIALQMSLYHPKEIVCVLKNKEDLMEVKRKFPHDATVIILEQETKEYPLKNNQVTFYICQDNQCLPPTNEL